MLRSLKFIDLRRYFHLNSEFSEFNEKRVSLQMIRAIEQDADPYKIQGKPVPVQVALSLPITRIQK